MEPCRVCSGKRYIIATRGDGARAVERCDECSSETLSDPEAALLAIADGIWCSKTYPCVLKHHQRES